MQNFDVRTLALFIVYVVVLPLNFYLTAIAIIPLWLAFLIGLCAFNLSFTIWHECVHNTIAENRKVCTFLGILTSLFLIYPGYFYLRKDHFLHHKHQGNPDKDPVYPRVQCRPVFFPIKLIIVTLFNPQPFNTERKLTRTEFLGDLAQYITITVFVVLLFITHLWLPFVVSWVLPRIVIFPIHAFYVCYLPHSGYGKGFYHVYRVVLRNPFTRYLTLYHSYHGMHHLWPKIPWHRYRAAYKERKEELIAKGVKIEGADDE
jgi:beta-carotene hydroxylase